MLQGIDTNNNDSDDDGLNQSFMADEAAIPSADSEHFLPQNDMVLIHVAQLLNITIKNPTNRLTSNLTMQDDENAESLPHIIILTVCYSLIFVAGVLGNLITCIVISKNNFMHTATNFYLFNLAVSDLMLLVSGMPQELYGFWYPKSYPFTDIICIMCGVLCEMAANTTVLTITAFTVERYIAICHPFRQHTMSKLSRAIKFIFAIWLTGFLLALPQAMQFSVVYQNGGYSCTRKKNEVYDHVFAVSSFIFFGGPMTAICVLYMLIGLKLKRSRLLQSQPRRTYEANRGLNAQSRVIRMLVAVAVAFFLCWAPFHAQRLMAVYGETLLDSGIDRDFFNDCYNILTDTSGLLYYLSTCINPLLYNIMSHKFREAFKITLTRQFGLAGGKHKQGHHQHNYSALLRHNGSMRLQSYSVNNNALETYGSYRTLQFRCRDASNHLSLQDSIRTTTTTTSIHTNSSAPGGSAAAAGVARRTSSMHRARRHSQQKHCLHGSVRSAAMPHRILHTSQLSSVGDANSLLEMEVDVGCHYAAGSGSRGGGRSSTPTSYRKKRALLATKNGTLLVSPTPLVAAVDGSKSPLATTATGKRLKLSHVISRRDELAYNSTGTVTDSAGGHGNNASANMEQQSQQKEACDTNRSREIITMPMAYKFSWRKLRQKHEKSLPQSVNNKAKLSGEADSTVAVIDATTPKSPK